MVESILSFCDAKQKLENEITDRQKHLIRILENPSPHSVTERELLESEIEDRCIVLRKLDTRVCACGLVQDAKALHIRIADYNESLPLTNLVLNKVRIRAECAYCLRATKEEISQAIEKMPFSQRQGLKNFAVWRVRTLGRASLGRTGDDLFQAAIEATFSGAENPDADRHWYKNRVDCFGHLKWVIQSISDHWCKKYKNYKESEPLWEAAIVEGDGRSPVDDLVSNQPSVEQSLIAREEVERLFRRFRNDKMATAILQAQCEGVPSQHVMREQGLTPYQYGAALRRIKSQKSVLIIEEYDPNQELLSRWLKPMDYAVVTASTASDGLRLYRECSPFDIVIISDSLNGVELAMAIRKSNRSQKIIITTTHVSEEDVVRPGELAVPILLKPFRRMELVAILESFPRPEPARNCRRKQRRTTHARKPVVRLRKVTRTRIPTQS